jgi:hypothetical protein
MGLWAGGLLAMSGCSIAGEWRAKMVEGDHPFPFSQVTFTDDGRYTAVAPPAARQLTSTGTYAWNGSTLKIMPKDGAERSYSGYHDIFKNQLVLKHKEDGKEDKATLEKVETQAK